jgi:hypothetical protein
LPTSKHQKIIKGHMQTWVQDNSQKVVHTKWTSSTMSNIIIHGFCFEDGRNSILIIIQFNPYLFTCKLNSPEADYKVSTREKKEKQQNTNKIQNKAVYIVVVVVVMSCFISIRNLSLFFGVHA